MQTPDFGPLAARYDELRRPNDAWWAVVDALVREADLRGRRVLDVGCGTGTLAAALAERHACKVWGVDPTAEMLAIARSKASRRVGFKRGRAESLPFRDGWFERVTMSLVVHLLDRARAFAEARRVLADEGRLAIATFDPASFDRYYLADFFPSIPDIDRRRFPDGEALLRELAGAGLGEPTVTPVRERVAVGREDVLAKIRGRHISTFQLIGEDEYRDGAARAERELPERVESSYEMLVVVARA